MKKLLTIIVIYNCANFCFAQVGIGGIETVSGNSAILDFAGHTSSEQPSDQETTNDKGIILPSVKSSPSYIASTPATNMSNNGTFIFDRNMRMVRMFENGIWINLSTIVGKDIPANTVNTTDEVGEGVIIGTNTTDAIGALVLESNNKALILPHIKNPHNTVKNPYPGMMCYDTVSNSLAIFDGANWNYWK